VFETIIKVSCQDPVIAKRYPLYPAKERYADLIEKFELNKKNENKFHSHPKRCPGIMDIMFYGYIFQTWCDIRFLVDNEKLVHVEASLTDYRAPLEIWDSEAVKKTNENSHWCGGYIKLTSPWHISTPPDTNVILDRLPYKNEDIFECATGLYDTSALQELNVFIKVTKKNGSYLIPAGTPLYQIYPIKTASYKLQYSKKSVDKRELSLMDKFRGTLIKYNKNKFKFKFK